MAFKDEWKDLKDATAEVPNSGDDISVEPINKIAHQVILNEENIVDKVDKEDGKGLSTNDFTDEYKEKVEKSGEQVQSDWSQNDKTAPDYVKNRTHYEVPRVVLAEVHLTAEETSMENGFDGICDVRIDKSLVEVGKEYKYTINGQNGTFIFSDEYMEFGGTSGSVYDNGNEYDWQTSWSYGSTIDIILYDVGEVKQLDEKYIPDSIARVADVEEILDELHAYAQTLIGGDA